MMMDQRQREKLLHKTEACAFVAGVAAELRLVAAQGDIANTNNVNSTTTIVSQSHASPRIHDANHLGLVAAVTNLGTVHRKKRMPRQRRSTVATSSTTPTLFLQMHHSDNALPSKHHHPNLPSSTPSASSHVPPSSLQSVKHPTPPRLAARVSHPFSPFSFLFFLQFFILKISSYLIYIPPFSIGSLLCPRDIVLLLIFLPHFWIS